MSSTTTQPADADAAADRAGAAAAITLLRAGAVVEGLARYEQVYKHRDKTSPLPSGLHLRLVEASCPAETATAVRDMLLRLGADLSVQAAMNKPPEDVAAEYEELFAQGAVNARMLFNYLATLAQLGSTSRMADLLDPQRIKREQILPEADGALWQDAAAMLARQRGTENWQDAVKSVRRMHMLGNLDHYGAPIPSLLREIHNRVDAYIAEASRAPARWFNWIPTTYRLSSWAVISSGEGFNVPHFHPRGWLSGTLYLAGPQDARPDGYPAGALRVGAPNVAEGAAAAWPDLAVAPTPGTMVLMPSYFTHWTLPIGGPGLRIAIAFDVIDLRA